jgi:hyperosmotically inducible protein
MLRSLLRLILVLAILVAGGVLLLGWWSGNRLRPGDRPTAAVGTAGRLDTERARQAGAAVGEKAADAANHAEALLADGALTAKIKSKMGLDDTVRARSIDVSTTNHVVTLRGSVRSEAEHARAVQLATETAGVTAVKDHLTVGR